MREQFAHHTVRRASATAGELAARRNTYVDVPEDDSFYPQPRPSSARRYTTTEGNRVIQQGNRRIVIHEEPPPKQMRKFHWLFYVGMVFFAIVIGWIALTLFTNWWQAKQADWKYGNPRTYQIDQFVGHSDSEAHPNHFVAVNIGGSIEVVELNTTTPKDDHIYKITSVPDALTPVTLNFADLNHDGKLDMVITIGVGNSYAVVLLNDGSEFKPQQ